MCQKLYVPNDICTQLFADANVRIQLYMSVYICVNMLMCVKRCIYLESMYIAVLKMLTYVYTAVYESI